MRQFGGSGLMRQLGDTWAALHGCARSQIADYRITLQGLHFRFTRLSHNVAITAIVRQCG
jgi:hypothetical protein